jgi:hypothetical protein
MDFIHDLSVIGDMLQNLIQHGIIPFARGTVNGLQVSLKNPGFKHVVSRYFINDPLIVFHAISVQFQSFHQGAHIFSGPTATIQKTNAALRFQVALDNGKPPDQSSRPGRVATGNGYVFIGGGHSNDFQSDFRKCVRTRDTAFPSQTGL